MTDYMIAQNIPIRLSGGGFPDETDRLTKYLTCQLRYRKDVPLAHKGYYVVGHFLGVDGHFPNGNERIIPTGKWHYSLCKISGRFNNQFMYDLYQNQRFIHQAKMEFIRTIPDEYPQFEWDVYDPNNLSEAISPVSFAFRSMAGI